MAHELAGALQQSGRIRQRRNGKEPHVYVRSQYIEVAEGRITQTCNRTDVVQDPPEFVPASSHHLKPFMSDCSQFTFMLFHPGIDGGIAFDSTIETKQLRAHRRSIFAFGSMLRGVPTRGTRGMGPQKRPCRPIITLLIGVGSRGQLPGSRGIEYEARGHQPQESRPRSLRPKGVRTAVSYLVRSHSRGSPGKANPSGARRCLPDSIRRSRSSLLSSAAGIIELYWAMRTLSSEVLGRMPWARRLLKIMRSPAFIGTGYTSKPSMLGLKPSRPEGWRFFHPAKVRKGSGTHWKPPMTPSISTSETTP